jgi:hypothetical protein
MILGHQVSQPVSQSVSQSASQSVSQSVSHAAFVEQEEGRRNGSILHISAQGTTARGSL